MPRIPRAEVEMPTIIGTGDAIKRLFYRLADEKGSLFFERLRYRLTKLNREAQPFGLRVVVMIPGTRMWVWDDPEVKRYMDAFCEALRNARQSVG